MERKEKKQKDQLLEEVLGKERKEKFMKELE